MKWKMKNCKIYIIPKQDSPIKIVFEELQCPALLKVNKDYRCKYAKTKAEGMNFVLYCSAEKCFYKLAYKDI